MNLSSLGLFPTIIFWGLLITGILLALALLLRLTKGVFPARSPSQIKKDQSDPQFAKERNRGQRFSVYTLEYVTPVFCGFVFLLVLWLLFR